MINNLEEYVDILDSKGAYIGKKALKKEAHKHGWYHPTVHVWFFTSDRSLLIQKRATSKKTFPSLWDVSVAGHVSAGESIADAAIREVEEEIGLKITTNDLQFVEVFQSTNYHPNGIIDAEFNHCFIVELKTSLQNLSKQDEEIDELKLININNLESKIRTKALIDFVEIEDAYWYALFEKIDALLK